MNHNRTPRQVPVRMALFPLIAIVLAVTMASMGRVWWCEAGDLSPWSWDVWSRHNSQHLVDPYTLSHIEHGIAMYVLLTLLVGSRMSTFQRSLGVAVLEAAWEIAENTPWVIQRYRDTTMALDYYGDSIVNSLGDYGACLAGVLVAQRVPLWASAIVLAVLELACLWWIRDSLILNILMLVWSIEAVRQWQMGGGA